MAAALTLLLASIAVQAGTGAHAVEEPAHLNFAKPVPKSRADAYRVGRDAIKGFAGCYLVDYSYVETESLSADYERDPRVYDVNDNRSVKEWITVEELSDRRLWVQHILYMPSMSFVMKHEAEDWTFEAPSLHAFTGPSTWERRDLPAQSLTWTRRVTNLDDGPRYQCASTWVVDGTGYPTWSCDSYAPIPGRETRDMQRSDYNTLQRSTRLVAYGSSWLERQDNIKTRDYANGPLEPLARELGKNWYVRLPDAECAEAQPFVTKHAPFWHVVRDVWDETMAQATHFEEVQPANAPPRYVKMSVVERAFAAKDLSDPAVQHSARRALRDVIDAYRVP